MTDEEVTGRNGRLRRGWDVGVETASAFDSEFSWEFEGPLLKSHGRNIIFNGGKQTMIYTKHSGFIRMSIVLGALALATWSMTSMLYAGQMGNNCMDECFFSWGEMSECLHISGETCELDACVFKEYAMIRCTECPIPGENVEGCKYHYDWNDWWRYTTIYEEDCLVLAPASKMWAACTLASVAGASGWTTPCFAVCYRSGNILIAHGDKPRVVCGELEF